MFFFRNCKILEKTLFKKYVDERTTILLRITKLGRNSKRGQNSCYAGHLFLFINTTV